MKLPKTVLVKGDAGEVAEIDLSKFLKGCARGAGLKGEAGLKAAEEMARLHAKGGEFDAADLEGDERKAAKALFKAVSGGLDASAKLAARAEADQKKAEEAAQKEREQLWLSAPKGAEIAQKAFEDVSEGAVVSTIKRLTGGTLVPTSVGLTVNDASSITAQQLADAIATMIGGVDQVDRVSTSLRWNIGDAVVFAEQHFDNATAEDIINGAVSALGKDKHTVREAVRLAKAVPFDKRIEGLSMTHHYEIFTAYPSISDKDRKAVIDLVLAGEAETQAKLSNGKAVEVRKPLTVKATRLLLQDRCHTDKVKKTKEKRAAAEAGPRVEAPGFLYFFKAEGIVAWHRELSVMAAEDSNVIVVDLLSRNVLDGPNNELEMPVLGDEWLAPAEKPKARPKKKPGIPD